MENVGDSQAKLTYRWDKNLSDKQPKLTKLEPTNLTCSAVRPGKIDFRPQTLSCSWASPLFTNALVLLSTEKHGSTMVTIRRELPIRGKVTLLVTTRVSRVVSQDTTCGGTVRTPNLHDNKCEAGCVCLGDGKWCQRNVSFSVSAGGARSTIHSPYLECIRDNDRSCAWNATGDAGRLQILSNDGKTISAQRAFGSRDIDVRLCAHRSNYDDVDEKSQGGQWSLVDGATFTAEVPIRNTTAVLQVELQNFGNSTVQVGKSFERLRLINTAETTDRRFYSYRLSTVDLPGTTRRPNIFSNR